MTQIERIYSLVVWTLIHKFVNFTQIEVSQWVFIFVAAVAIVTVSVVTVKGYSALNAAKGLRTKRETLMLVQVMKGRCLKAEGQPEGRRVTFRG